VSCSVWFWGGKKNAGGSLLTEKKGGRRKEGNTSKSGSSLRNFLHWIKAEEARDVGTSEKEKERCSERGEKPYFHLRYKTGRGGGEPYSKRVLLKGRGSGG